MTCQHVQEHYLEYMEQSLTPALASEFEEHLRDCDGCARELTMLRWTAQTLHAMPSVAPPSDLRLCVRERILQQPSEPEPPAWRSVRERLADWLRPRRWAVPASLAAVAAVLLIAVALPTWRKQSSESQLVATAPPSAMQRGPETMMKSAPPSGQYPLSNATGEPPVNVEINPKYGRNTSPSPNVMLPPSMGTTPTPPNYRQGNSGAGFSSQYPFRYNQQPVNPYRNDIQQPPIQPPGIVVHPRTDSSSQPTAPSVSPDGNVNPVRPPYVVQNPNHPSGKTQGGEGGDKTGGSVPPGGAGTKESSQSGNPDTSASPDSVQKNHAAPEDGSSKAQPSPPRGAAKDGGEKGASDTVPAPPDSGGSKTASGKASPLGISTQQLVLYQSRPQPISFNIQPAINSSNVEVFIIPPHTMRVGSDPLGQSRIVYRGPVYSHQPIPIQFQLTAFAAGRHYLYVMLRSASLAQPITQRIVVQVTLGPLGR